MLESLFNKIAGLKAIFYKIPLVAASGRRSAQNVFLMVDRTVRLGCS